MDLAVANELAASIATSLMDHAPVRGWRRIELRVIRYNADTHSYIAGCHAGRERHFLRCPDDLHDRLEELARLVSTPERGLFTKMSLDVDADGSFEARYGYAPISDDEEFVDDNVLLSPAFWP